MATTIDMMAITPLALLLAPLLLAWGANPPAGSPGFVLSREERYIIGARQDYVEGTKTWIEAMRSSGIALTFATFGDSDGNVEYNAPVARLEDIGPTLRAWAAAEDHLHNSVWGRRRQAAVHWARYSLWWQSPELSYRSPKPSAVKMPYFIWKNLRLHPADEPLFLETAARIRALLEANSIDRGLGVFRNISGAEGPLYTIIIPGRDPSELDDWLDSTWNDRRAELQPFLDELCKTIEEITEGRGWDLPELSLKAR